MNSTFDYNNKMKIMKKIYIFRYLTQGQCDILVKNFKALTFAKGEAVFLEGEIGNEFYIIKSGEVEIIKENFDDVKTVAKKRLRTIGKHDYFGERALIYNE